LREGDGRAVQAEHAAAAGHELDQVASEFGIGEQVADVIVEEDRVERLEAVAPEHLRVAAHDGLERARFLAHEREGVVGVLG